LQQHKLTLSIFYTCVFIAVVLGAGGAESASAPQKFLFVKTLRRISEKLGKTF